MNAVSELTQAKFAMALGWLVLFWCWETWRPFFDWKKSQRIRHAARNLTLAATNTIVLAVLFGSATILTAARATEAGWGLLNSIPLPGGVRFASGLVLLDAWMYFWHRANHVVPLLWRFHRMHHSDTQMDVTSATRFHLGELSLSAGLRLGLIVVLGLDIRQIIVYEMLVSASTQFHHADISLGRFDRFLRLILVTPDMHKVHHSRLREETNSNYATVLSIWDRLAATFRSRLDPKSIDFGLDEFREDEWQGFVGLWKTPFVKTADSGDVESPTSASLGE